MSYLEEVYKKAMLEKLEKNFSKFFPNLFKFYHKDIPSVSAISALSDDGIMFYSILSAMANDNKVQKMFIDFKNALVQNPIYNKDYWHLTDGYLSEDNPQLKKFMADINSYLLKVASAINDLIESHEIDNKHTFIIGCLDDLDAIIKQDYKNGKTDVPMSSFEFAEITMIKYLKEHLTLLLEGKRTIDIIIST